MHASDRVPGAVIHVPHCSTVVPADVRGQFVIGDGELHGELLAMTDHLTDRLFAVPEELAFTVRYGVSRLVVDPERFRNDADERMAACGMGAVYTATSRGTPLRCRLTEWEREDLLRRFYDPHQARLTQAVSAALDAHGCCLIIDAHSFPSKPLPYELDRKEPRPGICIGTDEFHTPPWLQDAAVSCIANMAQRMDPALAAGVNRPFAGALVPRRFHRGEPQVLAVMIEVNRGLYMDEASGEAIAAFDSVARGVQDAVGCLVERVMPASVRPETAKPGA